MFVRGEIEIKRLARDLQNRLMYVRSSKMSTFIPAKRLLMLLIMWRNSAFSARVWSMPWGLRVWGSAWEAVG